MSELKITKERILEAASKCEQAKAALKTLFPEVFDDDKYFDLSKLELSESRKDAGQGCAIFTVISSKDAGFSNSMFMRIRAGGNYGLKSFYLSNEYNWEIKTDDQGSLCLVPTKKTYDDSFGRGGCTNKI